MNILAFDTSFSACSVALQQDDRVTFLHQMAPMQHTRLILPMIQELLSAAALSPSELDAIAYGCGPGSFTGIRIANSVAQGIGFGAQIPLFPVSSLAAMAQTCLTDLTNQISRLLVAVQAQREQIYWAVYEPDTEECVTLLGQECLCSPEEIRIPSPQIPINIGVGNGWEMYLARLTAQLGFTPQAIHSQALPTAQAILKLASSKIKQGKGIDAANAMPIYLG